MTISLDTKCTAFLGNNSDTVEDRDSKYKLYNNCISEVINQEKEFENYNDKKINENVIIEKNYEANKKILKEYKNKKLTYDEELINNKKTINFLVIENRITLGVIILLIFLIYKYILK